MAEDAAATTASGPGGTGLRRQPTKYPHGLNITVQTIDDDNVTNEDYSRASTLKSSASSASSSNDSCWTDTQKYRIGMLGSPETLAELQVRRYKYPLTANYYLNGSGSGAPSQQQKPTPLMLLGYARRACRWKYLRWPIIFVASVLLFFGLITYCLWLHDLSVARARFLQRRYEATMSSSSSPPPPNSDWSEENESYTEHYDNEDDDRHDPMRSTSTEHVPPLQESTRLRAVDMHREPTTSTTETGAGAGTAAQVESIEGGGDADYDDVLLPADSIRFTSGHQNSFGVPIEQDKRMLQLLKDVSTRRGTSKRNRFR